MTSTIRKFQSGKLAPKLLMQRAPFQRMVKEARTNPDLRFQKHAIDALQEGAEAFLLEYLEGSNVAAVHRHAITTTPKDIELVQTFKNENMHVRSFKRNEEAKEEAAKARAEATAKAYAKDKKKKDERVKPTRVGA
jgi:histone H3-like centromeric protein A